MKIKDGKITITSKIAYIAGFFDGEGCIRIKEANQGGNSYYVTVHITNSNQKILMEIQDLFGGQVNFQERGVNKTIYNLLLTSSEAIDFLKTLSPFLKDKLEQALLAIKFHEQKGELSGEDKKSWARVLSEMKKESSFELPKSEIIGNKFENPDLLPNNTTE